MKKYLSQLRPAERRLVVGVGVVLFIVLNFVFIWPHFSDWSKLRGRLAEAQRKLKLYQEAKAQIPALEKQVKVFTSAGQTVAPEDQAIDLMRTIQSQAAASGLAIQNFSPSAMRTNDAFFLEQVQNITVTAPESNLVDFLYHLGASSAMVRVRDLALQPDQARQKLTANIKLVASYQKVAKPAAAPGKPGAAPAKSATPPTTPAAAAKPAASTAPVTSAKPTNAPAAPAIRPNLPPATLTNRPMAIPLGGRSFTNHPISIPPGRATNALVRPAVIPSAPQPASTNQAK